MTIEPDAATPPATPAQAGTAETMLDHLGGRRRLRAFVHHFHQRVLADDLLGEMFARGKPTHSAHLAAFLEEVMGGRQGYTAHYRGVEGLFDAHQNLQITDEQRRRFVELMMASADEAGLPADDRFRTGLRSRVEAGSMFSMILSRPGAERFDPWPPVGRFDW
jgi:hemoglobin